MAQEKIPFAEETPPAPDTVNEGENPFSDLLGGTEETPDFSAFNFETAPAAEGSAPPPTGKTFAEAAAQEQAKTESQAQPGDTKANDLKAEASAKFYVQTVDIVFPMLAGLITGNPEETSKYRLKAHEARDYERASAEYFKTVNFNMSPATAFIIATCVIFLPRVPVIIADRNATQRAKAEKARESNRAKTEEKTPIFDGMTSNIHRQPYRVNEQPTPPPPPPVNYPEYEEVQTPSHKAEAARHRVTKKQKNEDAVLSILHSVTGKKPTGGRGEKKPTKERGRFAYDNSGYYIYDKTGVYLPADNRSEKAPASVKKWLDEGKTAKQIQTLLNQ